MMTLFAEDLQRELLLPLQRGQDTGADDGVPVDIGLTNQPFYTDKSSAVTQSRVYGSEPTHVHLLGYDTLVRFLAPKYYAGFHPPLSALTPFFGAGHLLQVLLRPETSHGEEGGAGGLERQRAYVRGVSEGALAEDGFQAEWARHIGVLECSAIQAGISSTKVREAARRRRWDDVERMCSPGVAAWVKEMGLYGEKES
jgi:nicotinamide-nucleotide adenylyltransferase